MRVTALAARLLLLGYNLWNLFLRLLEPRRHVEAAGGRSWFWLIGARLVRSGRQKAIQISVQGAWWNQLKEGYQRLCRWLALTAPQLTNPVQPSANLSNKPTPGSARITPPTAESRLKAELRSKSAGSTEELQFEEVR